MRTCAIFTGLFFFAYDLEWFIDVCVYERHNSNPPAPTSKRHNDVSRSKNRYVTLLSDTNIIHGHGMGDQPGLTNKVETLVLYKTPSTLHRFQTKTILFCSVFKKIRVHTYRFRIVFARPHYSAYLYRKRS